MANIIRAHLLEKQSSNGLIIGILILCSVAYLGIQYLMPPLPPEPLRMEQKSSGN